MDTDMIVKELKGEGEFERVEPQDIQAEGAFPPLVLTDATDVTVITSYISIRTLDLERMARDRQFRAELASFADDWDDPDLDVYSQV